MGQKRLLFSALFLLGTVLAGFGWVMELRYADILPPEAKHWIGPLTIAGHVLHVIAVFCMLVTPDGVIEDDQRKGDDRLL